HVGNRFMRVGVKRGADSRRIVDLEERHLVTLDKRFDEHIAAIHRLALDSAYRHSVDVSISRLDHTGLPWVTTPINRKRREPQLHLNSLQHFIGQKYCPASYLISSPLYPGKQTSKLINDMSALGRCCRKSRKSKDAEKLANGEF